MAELTQEQIDALTIEDVAVLSPSEAAAIVSSDQFASFPSNLQSALQQQATGTLTLTGSPLGPLTNIQLPDFGEGPTNPDRDPSLPIFPFDPTGVTDYVNEYRAEQEFTDLDRRFTGTGYPNRDVPYNQGDAIDFESLSPAQRFLVKRRLADAGLISQSSLNTNMWTDSDAAAMRQLMAQANNVGTTWETVLEVTSQAQQGISDFAAIYQAMTDRRAAQIKAARGGGGVRRAAFRAPVYEAPDYATLAQAAKDSISQNLGREVQDWEMEVLTEFLADTDRKRFDQQVDVARANYYGRSISSEKIDTGARFQEFIEERYAPEIERNENVASTARNFAGFLQSVTAQDRQVG